MDLDVVGVEQLVSTGALPDAARVDELVASAHERNRWVSDGVVADYIPALAAADPEAFGVCVADVGGSVHAAGDVDVEFSIQSISKAFVYALVCEVMGHREALARVGVNNTGLSFNSVVAIELNDGHPMNPMVNAGAIATTGSRRSRGTSSASTRRSTPPRRRPTSATRRSPGCSRATGGSTRTPDGPSTCTRASAPSSSPPATSRSWRRRSPTGE